MQNKDLKLYSSLNDKFFFPTGVCKI